MKKLLVLLVVALLVVPATADLINIEVTKNGTQDWRPWQTAIDGQYLIVGYTSSLGAAALYADVATAIGADPSDVTINSAKLYMQIAAIYNAGTNVTVAPITEDWNTETGSTIPSYGSSTYGNGYTGEVSVGAFIPIEVTDIVTSWIDGSQTNYGVMITDGGVQFAAYSAQAYTSNRPYYQVDYTVVPEPITIGFLAIGGAVFSFRKRRKA